MKLKQLIILAVGAAVFFIGQFTHAQGILVLSNTNEVVNGSSAVYYGAYAIFVAGPNPTGYELTAVDVWFGDNSGMDSPTVRIELYGSNSPINPLDSFISGFTVPTPTSAGIYSYPWPTNVFLAGDADSITYYTLFVEPSFTPDSDTVNLAYTTSTNYAANAGWSFVGAASRINGTPGLCPLFNIYATVLPPPVLYPIHLINTAELPDGSFQFGFTNSPGLSFTAYGTIDLTLPFADWFFTGTPENIASNYYQYNSGPGVITTLGYPHIFFRVTSP